MEFITNKIGNIADLKAGGDAPKYVSNVRTDEFCYPIFSNGISNEGLYGYTNKYTMSANTLTISARGTIGAVFYRKEPYLPIVRLISIIPNENIILPKYMYYLLKSFPIEGFGAVQQQLTIPYYKKTKVTFEKDLKTQDKVASILSTYDDLIEKNNRKIEILQEMAEELYKEWFVRFRFPGYKTAKFIDGIPEGWEYKPFSDVATFERGVSYSSEEIDCEDGINLINLKNINSFGGFRLDGTKKYNGKYRDTQVVKCGDLVMGVTDMTQDRRTVGAVALIPYYDNVCVISADLVKLVSKVDNIFIYCLCRYGYYSKFFSQFANGSNVLHLKPTSLRNKKVLMPKDELIKAFVKIVKPMSDSVNGLNRQNELLKQQRDLLLPRLMSGKLEVKVS